MSLLFGIPSRIACDILLKWLRKHCSVIDYLRDVVDHAVCNKTWRPFYIALLHNVNFVVEEDIEFFHELLFKRGNQRKRLIYLEWMRIKLKNVSFSSTGFFGTWNQCLDTTAIESIAVRSYHQNDSQSLQGLVNFINSTMNLKRLDPFDICGNDKRHVGVCPHEFIKHKDIYALCPQEQASYLVKIHVRVLQQLTHIGLEVNRDNKAPEIVAFVKLMEIHCSSLVKLDVHASNIPTDVYKGLINKNRGLTWIELGEFRHPVSADLIFISLHVHGFHLEHLKLCCTVEDEEQNVRIREGMLTHKRNKGAKIMKNCLIEDQHAYVVVGFYTVKGGGVKYDVV